MSGTGIVISAIREFAAVAISITASSEVDPIARETDVSAASEPLAA